MLTTISNVDWMTKFEAAMYLKVSERTVDRLVKDGKLVMQKLGRRTVRISTSSVEALLR